MLELFARVPNRFSHLERSFLAQRTGMALLAGVFPLAFLSSSFILGRTSFQTSLSAYYWTLDPERNFFVGVLCAVAVFLALYQGYTWIEDRVLDLAGLAAAGMAFFPTERAGECAALRVSVHGVFAVTFFSCIAYICIFMSKHSLEEAPDPHRLAAFRRAYRICSAVMIGTVAVAVLAPVLPVGWFEALCEKSLIFWLESFAVWSFSAFWYIKTRELDPSRSWIPFRMKPVASRTPTLG